MLDPIKILVLFLSMTILSIFLDETGFFKYLANAVLKKSGKSQIRLFTALFITCSLVTIFTSNDIIILTFTPFICYFCKNARVNPIPYLVSTFVSANTASMLLVIGNPTNIYLATAGKVTFFKYLSVMALPTLFAVTTAYVVMFLLFHKALKPPIEGKAETVHIERHDLLAVGLVLLSIGTIILSISSYVNIEMWLVALSTALLLCFVVLVISLIRRDRPKELIRTLKRTPWKLVPFVLIMFLIVMGLEKIGVTEFLANIFGETASIITYGVSSTIFANIMNNIPMSVLFTAIIASAPPAIATPAMYSAIIGSNIGAFLTPLGALAGLMWLSILRKNNVPFRIRDFIRYGLIIVAPVLASALLALYLVLP